MFNKTQPASKKTAGITQEERRFLLAFSLLVVIITTFPYLLAFSKEGKDFVFSGFLFGVTDGNSYIAKMLSGWSGSWVFRSPYTAYPQHGLPFFFLPYLLLGKLAAPPAMHTQLVILYHLFRIVACILLCFASYDFLSRFITGLRWRRLGLVLTIYGGGLGWLSAIFGHPDWSGTLPLDFYSPEAFGFLSLFGIPHMAMGRAVMLWALLAYLDLFSLCFDVHQLVNSGQKILWNKLARLSGLWLLAGLFNPLTPALIGFIILVHLVGLLVKMMVDRQHAPQLSIVRWRQLIINLLVAAVLPALFLAYNVAVSFFESYARTWSLQNIIRSPSFEQFLLAYGLLVPFAWFGAKRMFKWDYEKGWFLTGWVVTFPLLAYAPFDLQRRLIEGIWVALVTLAVAVFDRRYEQVIPTSPAHFDWRPVPLILAFPSTLFLLAGGTQTALHPVEPVFLPKDEVALFETLQSKSYADSVVLTAFDSGNAFPAWAPVFVLTGHGPESIHLAEVTPQVDLFYRQETPDAERMALIRQFKINFVLWGPDERSLGGWQPSTASFLDEFAHQGEYFLYEFKDPAS